VNIDELAQKLGEWRSRVAALLQRTDELPHEQQELLMEITEELHVATEELHVAQEQLIHQNEQLAKQNQELVAAREAVEAERQRYQELFDLAPDGYLVTNRNGTIQETNRAAAKLLNVEPRFLVGKPLTIYIAKEEHLTFFSQLSQLSQIDRLQDWEVRLQPRNGKFFDAALTVAPVHDKQGKLVSLRWLLRDITDRKQAELALKQAKEELEIRVAERTYALQQANKQLNKEIIDKARLYQEAQEANRIQDEFLAIVSHELRTPLNAMLGWVSMLRNRKLNEATTGTALETIERNAKLQGQLIEDILDISRIIRGQLRLNTCPVHLPSIIQVLIENVRPTAEIKGIQIESILDCSIGQVMGDPDRLQQIVWNLLSNAVKFTNRGGRVEVRLEQVNSIAQITVKDTGKGISADFLPYVFDRFLEADGTTTRSHGGLGLGLAIARHLVEMHNGTVHAASDGEGKGATFRVQLPTIDSQQVPPAEENKAVLDDFPALDGLQVLVVDDSTDTLELLTFILEQCNAQVITAASAAEAFDAIAKSKPDILISDIGMPEEDGYALIARIRSLEAERGGQIPAIALTAFATEEERIRTLCAGFQVHVPKPVEPAKLVAVVANLAVPSQL
jgi:PAS domain S-box-containing protein